MSIKINFKYYNPAVFVVLLIVLTLFFDFISRLIIHLIEDIPIFSRIVEDIDIVSTLTLLTGALIYIDRIGWKQKFFKWLIDIPNLNGRYRGSLVSSYQVDGVPVEMDSVIEIKQTASYIHICSYNAHRTTQKQSSSSRSISEQIIIGPSGFAELYCIFINEPEIFEAPLAFHAGTVRFKYLPDIATLNGQYYNARPNTGSIVVRFDQKKLLGRY